MKKFLEFIWELIGPVVTFIAGIVAGFLGLVWVFTGFGLLILLGPDTFPTPEWVKWIVAILDSFCAIMIIYSWIYGAYERVYKQN